MKHFQNVLALGVLAGFSLPGDSFAQATQPCRVQGIRAEVQCGTVKRTLDSKNPAVTIDVHYVVVPALARNKKQDALFFFAGGPGQSAIKVAPQVLGVFQRLNNWRDLVFIDQRGTGKTASLDCKFDDTAMSLDEMLSMARNATQTKKCLADLKTRPHGQLDQYTTTIAMQDADAVRAALGYEKINLFGASYGTRAVLEYQRLFPQRVRRAVIDGVAPPDASLPTSFSTDNQAALDLVLASCEGDAACKKAYPNLRRDWRALMDAPAREVKAINPLNGREESVTMDRGLIAGIVRGPLYAPSVGAALPHAITEAAAGKFTPLVGLGSALGGASRDMSWGMHFSVLCSEDMPRIAQSKDQPGADFGDSFLKMYSDTCAEWPKAVIDPAFYSIPAVQFPVLVLSGGADPATPPRHGERAAKALGEKAQHIVVPHAGHGVFSIGCMRDIVFKFLDTPLDADAQKMDASCVTSIPRPSVWQAPVVNAKGATK
jgi:pimeloyl-ACP methyl ester carboxylesterase